VVLVVLTLLAVFGFLAVAGLSRVYFRQQQFLGDRWFARGVADLKSGEPEQAVSAFRSALRYSRDNYNYQLSLAQALAALKRTDEAQTYLVSLWEREPENGTTSLELGRIYAGKGEMDPALRYYHSAVYAAWADDTGQHRRTARLELIDFLLRENAVTQAQSELIALAANMPEDSPLHVRVGSLFMQVQDYEHALAQYREALRMDRRNSAALAGAGRAAFELGRYEPAQRYLEDAVASDPQDGQSSELLQASALVQQMDPYRRQISISKRNRIVAEAFASAGERLRSCSSETLPGVASQPDHDDQVKLLASRWDALKSRITDVGLRENPDLVDIAMDLVFAIERQTSGQCGTPTRTDQALLLVSKLHGGN
jgi:tetratricopeptide (TPR) repeat protein